MDPEQPPSGDQPGEGPEKPTRTFNVAIIYDSRNAAHRAMEVYHGLSRQMSDEFELECDLWRFDVLRLPEVRERAILAGQAADLIIIAGRSDASLPEPVKDWFRCSLAGRAPASAALIGLLESHPALREIKNQTEQFLQRTADAAGMDLILHDVEIDPKTAKTLATLHSGRSGGINE